MFLVSDNPTFSVPARFYGSTTAAMRDNEYTSLHVPACTMNSCVSQETEKVRQMHETVLRDLRTKSEEDRGAHAREIERLEVSSCRHFPFKEGDGESTRPTPC